MLIEAFRQLCDNGLGGWELHLAGGIGSEKSSQEFLAALSKMATGYPIYFHLNASRSEIEKLYLQSKVYWHATGFGENENQAPIKMEHFGITPVEAISAGCTPLLYQGGGLPETITNLGAGEEYLFKTKEELIEKTKRIISSPGGKFLTPMRRKKLQQLYSQEEFRRKFLAMVKKKNENKTI